MAPVALKHYPQAQTEYKVRASLPSTIFHGLQIALLHNNNNNNSNGLQPLPSQLKKTSTNILPPLQPPLIANENAFLGDVSVSTDATAPIAAGFYRLEKGTPLVYEYTYHEMKIIVDGEFQISDETGQTVTGKKGDVFYFPKGSKITFTTETFGLGFFVGQRAEGAA